MPLHESITLELLMDAIERRDTCLDNPGFCQACGEEADGCEPDARNYKCEMCDENEVFGAEELLMEYA